MKSSERARDAGLDGFGFDDDSWLELARRAEEPRRLGRIGDYELEEEVSRGGQGIVFRALQPGTGRRIALKRLLAGSFATAGMHQRFRREVTSAARLEHPNIVTVYGMETVEGTPLLAMEWIDGVPVTAWSHGRTPDEVLELFLRLCDAVAHAHARGVLHRDLKPSNVLVDRSGQPHVLDFGLAKLAPLADGEESTELAGCSKSAEALGTPAYASPEQLSGDATRLDRRTDVYALGVLLFEMLTGASPYGTWRSIPELLQRVGSARPPRLARLDPRLGRRLDTIVRAAMAATPAERYPSVDALAADVRSYLIGQPIAAVPTSSWALAARLVRRNPVVSGLAGALVVVCVGFALWARSEMEDQRAQNERLRHALEEITLRKQQAGSLLAFVPDCVYLGDGRPSPLLVKPGMLLDDAVAYSSPNPYFATGFDDARSGAVPAGDSAVPVADAP